MTEILEIICSYCNSYGSYITLTKLMELWLKSHPSRESAFHEIMQALMCSQDIHMEFDRVYLKRVWLQENYAAERLHAILNAPHSEPVDLPDEMYVDGIRLTQEQRNAVVTCLNNPLTILTGPGGCGKTTIAQAIIDFSAAVEPLLCSPTGKAAKILGTRTNRASGTIHRMLGIRNVNDFLNPDPLIDVKLILVDEASMLTIDMLGGILRAAPDDCRIVLLGDRNQLPAIGPGNVLHDLIDLGVPCVRLTENHRISRVYSDK